MQQINEQQVPATSVVTKKRQSLGGSLYRVRRGDNNYYTMRYRDRLTGRVREKGIGPAKCMTQVQARNRVNQLKGMLYGGEGDPIDSARQAREDAARERAMRVTFADYSASYIAEASEGWRNKKHAAQWTNTLATYCKSMSGVYLRQITSDHVVAVLKPIWKKKHVTATRVRQRIEAILDAAAADGLRVKENPARWEGNLERKPALKVTDKLAKVNHHSALAYTEIREFMQDLAAKKCMTAKAMTLQILTATRPSEAVAAQWQEFNLDEGYWLIPEERMKSFRPHKVPLAPQLLKILSEMPKDKSGNVFPGLKHGSPVCTDAMLRLVKRMRGDITCHGFRSTFRSWVADKTTYPDVIAEMALAHITKDKVVEAYRRTTMYEKREALMMVWADHCMGPLDAEV